MAKDDTGGEFDVRRMFQSESPRINPDGAVQASLGAARTGQAGKTVNSPPVSRLLTRGRVSCLWQPRARGRMRPCQIARGVACSTTVVARRMVLGAWRPVHGSGQIQLWTHIAHLASVQLLTSKSTPGRRGRPRRPLRGHHMIYEIVR